jgi:hypothetical protein
MGDKNIKGTKKQCHWTTAFAATSVVVLSGHFIDLDRVGEGEGEDRVAGFVFHLDAVTKAEPAPGQLLAHYGAGAGQCRRAGRPGVGKVDSLVVAKGEVVVDMEKETGHPSAIASRSDSRDHLV